MYNTSFSLRDIPYIELILHSSPSKLEESFPQAVESSSHLTIYFAAINKYAETGNSSLERMVQGHWCRTSLNCLSL